MKKRRKIKTIEIKKENLRITYMHLFLNSIEWEVQKEKKEKKKYQSFVETNIKLQAYLFG